MDYKPIILQKLCRTYAGLLKDPGLTWLDGALNRLDAAGMNKTVKNFVGGMADEGNAAGFLLEIQCALAVMDAFPGEACSSERQDGVATSPGDITLETGTFRADFQCKSVLNYTNELWVDQLMDWVISTFPDHKPGLLLDFQAEASATEASFLEFRHYLEGNIEGISIGSHQEWQDSEGHRFYFALYSHSEKGIRSGLIWSSVDGLAWAHEEDIVRTRNKILARANKALHTFGYPASDKQFNIVVVEFPSNTLYDESSLIGALYGEEIYTADGGGAYLPPQSDPNGLYTSGALDSFSAVAWLRTPSLDTPTITLCPHPAFADAISAGFSGAQSFSVVSG